MVAAREKNPDLETPREWKKARDKVLRNVIEVHAFWLSFFLFRVRGAVKGHGIQICFASRYSGVSNCMPHCS